MAAKDALEQYRAKRDFAKTPEPADGGAVSTSALSFVIQKHWASHLHYDFRLELDGTMKSWAVPKGPSLDNHVKRMAVQVEDHPIAYAEFEGEIPEKQYGAGTVIIWDRGTWTPVGDPHEGYRDGNLKFVLSGEKLQGKWALIRMKGDAEKQQPWLLIKEKDAFVRPDDEYRVVDALPDSVVTPAGAAATPPASPEATKLPGKTEAAAKAKAAVKTKSAARTVADAGSAHREIASPAPSPAPRKRRAGSTSASGAAPALPAGAVPCALPETLSPELATLVDAPPTNGDDWVYELKFDGYRLLARIDGDVVSLLTRSGQDWTARMPHLQQAVASLQLESGWLDGEIVVLDKAGLPDFQALQNAFDGAATQDIVFYLFDVPYLAGHDLCAVPLVQRRQVLESLLAAPAAAQAAAGGLLRFSQAFELPGATLLASACKLGLEGVIGKRRDSLYATRRSKDWIKLKCGQRQEFVIGGYTDPQGARAGFGSLLLGVHDAEGRLQYAGNVGTGFDAETLGELHRQLQPLATTSSPFAGKTGIERSAHWVEPRLVAEVAFAGWTGADRLRHAVFHALRTDKPAQAIVRERALAADAVEADGQPAATAGIARTSAAKAAVSKPGTTMTRVSKAGMAKAAAAKPEVTTAGKLTASAAKANGGAKAARKSTPPLPPGLKVTHPEKIIDAASGTSKMAVVSYYARIAPLMMPHLEQRPTALVRAPDGVTGALFFQKHSEHAAMTGIALLDPSLDPGHAPLLKVERAEGLLAAAQMNVLEFHTWNAREDAIGKPDRMCFDLDPGAGVEWPAIREAALLVRELLSQLGLESFVKTSGGKGLHVVVPLKRRHDWDTVKDFSHAIVDHLARTIPQRFVAKSGPSNRVGKVFVDYLRNGFGATTAAAWSLRSRPGLGISVPIGWDELADVTGGAHWHLANIDARIEIGNTPWTGYEAAAQTLTSAMRRLGFTPARPT